ncbi:MAG: hypothetical protein R3D34_04945 [Nitratireductor sp.]
MAVSRQRRNPASIRDDLADALSSIARGLHAFSAEEKQMLNNILRLQDIRVV